MKEKLIRFMQGRYGIDQLGRFLMIVGIVTLVIGNVFPKSNFLLLSLIILIYTEYRTFSKNHQKRYKENQWFLLQKNKLQYFIDNFKNRKHVTDPYHIYKCPKCKQKLRIPKGKGRIEITCKNCSHKFIKKS